ncbi:hypothetical protein DT385_01480 [Pseudomonas syringae]|nr:hypothetical protein DT385_01480 [Pseudomonas syringae]
MRFRRMRYKSPIIQSMRGMSMIHLTESKRNFESTEHPGVSFLSIWGENGDGSDIVKFSAGARFPRHDHEGREEILMLSGRIRFGDLVLSAGDYLKLGPGE